MPDNLPQQNFVRVADDSREEWVSFHQWAHTHMVDKYLDYIAMSDGIEKASIIFYHGKEVWVHPKVAASFYCGDMVW
jgi:hypothetical protein